MRGLRLWSKIHRVEMLVLALVNCVTLDKHFTLSGRLLFRKMGRCGAEGHDSTLTEDGGLDTVPGAQEALRHTVS